MTSLPSRPPRPRSVGVDGCLVKIRYKVGGKWKNWTSCELRHADDERTKLLGSVPFVENILVTGAVLGGWMPERQPQLKWAANETTRPPQGTTPGACA